jgi:hypothetical protein
VEGSCEHSDETLGSCAMELVINRSTANNNTTVRSYVPKYFRLCNLRTWCIIFLLFPFLEHYCFCVQCIYICTYSDVNFIINTS